MLCMTIDTDWVPEFILQHTLTVLDAHNVRATVFCTSLYANSLLTQHEIALHPNLMTDATEGADEQDRLRCVHNLYPQAIGVRTHRLYWHSALHNMFLTAGLQYDSSMFCPLQSGLEPYNEVGLVRFPLWWVDNFHARMNFSLQHFAPPKLVEPGLKILLFHPLQIYLNTRSLQEATAILGKVPLPMQEEHVLAKKRRAGVGFETLFLSALKLFRQGEWKTMSELLP